MTNVHHIRRIFRCPPICTAITSRRQPTVMRISDLGRVVCMGCTPSSARRVSQEQDAIASRFAPPPPIPVSIGAGVRHHPHPLAILFIFGGPGSQKGLVIEELAARFDFVSISVEDIVFNYMPNKVANTVESIGEIQEMLKRDNGILTIDWILSMISAKITTSMTQRFVIDIVPTLSSIIKAESYRSKSHDRSLENFERRHPVMFALELAVSDEEALFTTKAEGKENDDAADKNQFKGVDEIDKGRLERRLDQYHQCAESFLRYFARSRRVVKLSLHGPESNVVSTVHDILVDFGFTTSRRRQQVLVFASAPNSVVSCWQVYLKKADESKSNYNDSQHLDLEYYKIRKVNVREINKSGDSLLTQMLAIYNYVHDHPQEFNFLFIIDSINDNESAKEKTINFMEKKPDAYLDEFITDKRHDKQPKARNLISVNCVSSTHQLFLFLEPFPASLAQKISLLYHKIRNSPAVSRKNS